MTDKDEKRRVIPLSWLYGIDIPLFILCFAPSYVGIWAWFQIDIDIELLDIAVRVIMVIFLLAIQWVIFRLCQSVHIMVYPLAKKE